MRRFIVAIVLMLSPTGIDALTLDPIIISKEHGGFPLEGKLAGGERVYLRIEASGFERKDGKADLTQDVYIEAPFGIVMVDHKNAGGVAFDRPLDPTAPATLNSTFEFPAGPPGLWHITITVNDRVAGTAATQKATIELLKGRTPGPVVK